MKHNSKVSVTKNNSKIQNSFVLSDMTIRYNKEKDDLITYQILSNTELKAQEDDCQTI